MGIKIIWLDDVKESDLPLVGGKASNLAKLRQAGFRTPAGFCVTTEAWDEFAKDNCLVPMAETVLKQTAVADARPECDTLKHKILSGQFARSFLDDLNYATSRPDFKVCEKAKFAVRSSATAEDCQAASFAGQFQSFIGVEEKNIATCIKLCWASLFSPSVLSYAARKRIALRESKMAVLVHQAIQGDLQGVCFTQWGLPQDRDLLIVESREAGDEKNLSRFALSRRDGTLLKFKEPLAGNASQGQLSLRLEAFAQEGLNELFDTCMALERYFGAPQDIEWIWGKQRLTILQSRPQTCDTRAVEIDEGVWSRSICEDLWPEAMTPMTASIIIGKLNDGYVMKEPLAKAGLGDLTSIKALNLIDHRLFLNCHAVLNLIKRIPPLWEIEDVRDIFPRWLASTMKPERSLWRLLPIFAKFMLLPFRDRFSSFFLNHKKVRREASSIERHIERALSEMGRGGPLAELFDQLEALLYRVAIFQKASQWSYFYAAFFPMILRKMVKDWCCGDDPLFASLLLSPQDNKTLETNRAIAELSRQVKDDINLKSILSSADSALLWDKLKEDARFSSFVNYFEQFLHTHGHRSSRRDLSAQRWSENPGPVIEFINGYLKPGDVPGLRRVKEEGHNKARQAHEKALASLNQNSTLPVRALKKIIFKKALDYTRIYISLREDLRFYLDKALFASRQLLLVCAQNLCESRILNRREEIFYITFDELKRISLGDRIDSLDHKVASRMASYNRAQSAQCPRFIIDGHPYYQEEAEAPAAKLSLKGIGVSPGVVKGRARVLYDEADIARIEPGEVLVAENIDTGLTPLLALASAVLSESGGLLAHSSIVAREFCVPMVAGLKGATNLIRTGQELLVDGGRGLVFLEEPIKRQQQIRQDHPKTIDNGQSK